MTKDRGVYGQVSDLLDEAKDALSIGAVLAAIANTDDALRLMREYDLRLRAKPAARPTTPGTGEGE